MEYTIEMLSDGDKPYWFILGSERLSSVAQDRMEHYRKLFPRESVRVVENDRGSRVIVCAHCMNGEG